MAIILVLACGILGFTSAVASLVFFEATLIQALGLWVLCGSGALVSFIVPALLPRRPLAEDRQTEIA